ncbi:uncharacterized protein TNCV_1651361 [Trichonephila clavipes]|nr:uncharacterized protein TNCV_1651361 [Trichonephila clavipes]
MDLMSSRYRKPKGRLTKRRKMLAENRKKRWQKSSKTVDEKTVIAEGMLLWKRFHLCSAVQQWTENICQMHAQLIREKQTGEEKMLEMSRQAAREAHVKVDAYLKSQKIIDVSVSYDGTWQKRGHTSNLGLGIIIDILSGLVLDFEVLSKYSHNCVVAGRDMGV